VPFRLQKASTCLARGIGSPIPTIPMQPCPCTHAVQAEWTPNTAEAQSQSGVWVTKKGPAGTPKGYLPWVRLITDQTGAESQAEFGTSIKVGESC
jgi:hypothetical protein